MALIPAHTYSIVARDPETGELGVAVQSHYFCVGPIVPWAQAGVGAVATQSFVEISYGPLGLELMRGGKTVGQALQSLLAGDEARETRQVAMIDTHGNTATHTGSKCIAEAGHREGTNYSVQANLMLNNTVWDAMAEAFEGSQGDLAERLLKALLAAEGAGGDIRGKQSAALLVVGGERTGLGWGDRLFDLRVDDSLAPLEEMRRLLDIARAYSHGDRAERAMMLGDTETAVEEFDRATRVMPDMDSNPEPLFWYAVSMASAGNVDRALPVFARVFALNENWRTLVPRLVPGGQLPDDEQLIRRILEVKA